MTHADVSSAYDLRAAEYIALFGRVDLLAAPDQDLIARWRDATPGRLLDAGCGPAHWTEFLRDAEHQVIGLDGSTQFLAHARAHYPAVALVRAAIGVLPLQPASIDGILAWYSIIHTPPGSLGSVFAEFRRVLKPGGSVLLGFVDGAAAAPFPHAVHPAYFWSIEAIENMLGAVGLTVLERERRRDQGARPHAALVARLGDPG